MAIVQKCTRLAYPSKIDNKKARGLITLTPFLIPILYALDSKTNLCYYLASIAGAVLA